MKNCVFWPESDRNVGNYEYLRCPEQVQVHFLSYCHGDVATSRGETANNNVTKPLPLASPGTW